MLFFLNDGIQENKSGIEHAQMKRLKLFKQFKQPAMIVTRQYSNELHLVTKHAGIADADFVNLFDYFQNARVIPQKDVTIKDIQIDPHWQRQADGINYSYSRNGHRILYVRRRNDAKKHVINLQYFDHYGKLLNVKWYDVRGFISVEQVYDWQGNITTENYFRPDGKLVLQLAHMEDKRGQKVDTYHLFDYQGQDFQFTGLDELTSFFLDQLVIDREICGAGPVGMIVDRVFEVGWSVLHMKHRVARYMQLHNDHVNNNDDILHSTLNYNYEWGLRHIQDWDGVIALTPQQEDDLKARFGKFGVPIFRVPGPIVPAAVLDKPHVPFTKRTKNQVVMVARLSPEKQQDQLLTMFAAIHQQVPTSRLTLYGYGPAEDVKRYKDQVKQAGIADFVNFAGYQVGLDQVYDQAQLFVDASRIDAQPLAMGEALSHGVPVVAYDYLYGPASMIESGVNGELIPLNDQKKFVNAAVRLLKDAQELQKLSTGAYNHLDAISDTTTWQQWAPVVGNN